MSDFELAADIVIKNLQNYKESFKQNFTKHSIFYYWREIAGAIGDEVFPIKVDGDVIVLYSQNSAAKNEFKFLAKDILDSANKFLGGGENIFSKFSFAKSFSRPRESLKKFRGEKKKSAPKFDISSVELSAAEIAECEKKVADVKNVELKKIALESLIAQKKLTVLKLKQGWHKCKCCEVLCPPEEIICASCRISERNKMRGSIRQIFLQNPAANFYDVLGEVKNHFPHLSDEIFLGIVSSERNALINSLATKVSFGDAKSDAAKTLVQLYRQIPREKLTDAIINRALKELRFNLVDQPPLQKKNSRQKSG